jgi:hypothetical protein
MSSETNSELQVEWPLILFEQDDYPMIAQSFSELEEMYEENYWDEVAVAFDSGLRRVSILVVGGTPSISRSSVAAPEEFVLHARAALKRNACFTRWRRIRVTAEESVRIDNLDASELQRELLSRRWG